MGINGCAHGDKWAAMSAGQRNLIQLALAHGYPNEGNIVTLKDANACYAATQLIVWQISFGFRTSPTALNDRTYPMSGHTGTMTQQLTANAHLKRYYDAILTAMANHYLIPSFTGATAATAPTYSMTYSGGQYRLTLTDTTGVLPNFTGVSDGGLNAGFSGNSLVLSSSTPITGTTTVVMTKKLGNVQTTGFLIWSVPGKEGDNQDMVTGVDVAPVPCYVKLMTDSQPSGNLRITKTVVGGNGGSFQFEVRDSAGTLSGTYTIQNSGVVTIPDLPTGSYSVREINIPAGYILQSDNPQTVSVFDGETTGVEFVNVCQQGQIVVRKINSNPGMGSHSLAAAVFEIWNPSGSVLYDTIITNASGVAVSGMLSLGDYVVREKTPPSGFIRNPNSFPVTLSAGGTEEVIVGEVTIKADATAELAIENKLQRGALKITKTFEGLKKPVAGVKFTVEGVTAAGGKFSGEYETDKDGVILAEGLPVGEYVVKEVASELNLGYVLADAQVVVIKEGETTELAIENKLAKGKIEILKIDAEDKKPLADAMFGLYQDGKLVSEAKSDKNGVAIFSDIPFGDYEVRELSAPVGYQRDDTSHKVTIGEGKTQISLTFTNEKLPGEPVAPSEPEKPAGWTPPKMGDDTSIVKWLAIVGCVAFITAGYFLLRRRKRGEGDEPVEKEEE